MNEMKRLLSFVRRAVDDYSMIEENDKIAVGLSGGKDSLTLLETLAAMRRFYPKKYDVVAITVDMGFPDADFSALRDFCEKIGVKFIVAKTDIAKIIFDVRRESNPCSLCAKMRRGALHLAAVEEGCNKVALGHHFDDVVETFMLNLFFEGRLGCFSPVTYLSNRKITVIRPLIYAEERDVSYFAKKRALPISKNPCPEDHNTEREKMKARLLSLEKENHGLRHRIFHAICRGGLDGFKLSGRFPDAGKIEE